MKFICRLCGATFKRDIRTTLDKGNYRKGKGYRSICSVAGRFTWAKEAGK